MATLEQAFSNEMKNIYITAKKDLGYNATRFLQLLSQKGGVEAARQLIAKDGGTYGFEVLWEAGRLDLSVEALVLDPKYLPLFSESECEICRERLLLHGYSK